MKKLQYKYIALGGATADEVNLVSLGRKRVRTHVPM